MRDEIGLLRQVRPSADGPDPVLAGRAREELMASIAGRPTRIRAFRRTRRRSLRFAVPAAALAVAAAVALSLTGRGSETAWAAELVRVAEAAPRLLVEAKGWHVTRADQFGADYGEMTFSDGERELDLHWQPARLYVGLVKDRGWSADPPQRVEVAGRVAKVFRYDGTTDFVAIWVAGRSALEARGVAHGLDAFVSVLAAMHEVNVDTWLSAMPESVVRPTNRAEAVREMLEGIPLPPGFDAAELRRGDAIRDRYQLGAQVAGAVACAWIDRWVAARSAGNDVAVRAAVSAMQTSHTWPILLEMNEDGDYTEAIWEYADAMATNAPVSGGKPLTIEESYEAALGCPRS